MKNAMILACLVACSGGSTAPPDMTDPFPDACPVTACQSGPTVDNATQLATEVNGAAGWAGFGEYTTGCMPASSEIAVTGTVTLAGDSVVIPSSCTAPGCRQKVSFRLDPAATGVTCNEPEEFFDFTACGSITVTDSTVRVRAILLDIHPSAFGNFMPLVEVLGPCAADCGANRFACEADHTCWSSVRDHCAYCLNGSNEECACWDGDRLLPDGTACEMFVSGDVVIGGTCRDGACDTEQ